MSLSTGRQHLHRSRWEVPISRRTIHACAPASSGSDENTKPNIDPDAVLAAFDKALDAEIILDRAPTSSSGEKRKLTKEEREQERDEAYLRRLEVLTALPTDLAVDAKTNQCPGCGCELQSDDPDSPGYVPAQKAAPKPRHVQILSLVDEDGNAAEENESESSPEEETKKPVICQRCYKLSHYGSIADTLRVKPSVAAGANIERLVSDTTGPTTARGRAVLSAARFRKSLETLRKKSAVIVYLVDIFDFHGTFLTSLQDIVGDRNPLLLAVNKIDLLPKDFKAARVERWVRTECEALGLRQVAGVHMVSSTRGTGVADVLADAVRMARGRRCDIYVVGAANVGKSSFINKVVALRSSPKSKGKAKRGSKSQRDSALTTSVIPGTTLDSIRIPLGRDISLYDTPGIIVNHQLTNRLAADELRAVLPTKNVECVTYRLGEGKALYLGGLARIDVVEGKPFFFTVFVSPDVKVHPGKIEGAEEFLEKHVGELLVPPFDNERLQSMGQWTTKTFTAKGDGWKKASVDVVLSGLGWVAITGPGSVKLRVNVPYGMGVFTRDALMPFEAQAGVSKYTGSRGLNPRGERASRGNRKDDSFSSIDDWS